VTAAADIQQDKAAPLAQQAQQTPVAVAVAVVTFQAIQLQHRLMLAKQVEVA
jgi:hypothetical protein